MTERTVPLPGPIDLRVRVGRGSLTVNAGGDPHQARVSIIDRVRGDAAARYTVELSGRTLTVLSPREGGVFDLPFFGRGKDAVDVVVDVPGGTPVRLSSFAAGVVVTGRCGTADVTAGSATITLEQVDGDLRVRYGSGTCRVREVSGDVEGRAGSGGADFGRVGGSLSHACGSGDVRADTVGGTVRTRSGSGSVTIGAAHGDVDLGSGSGTMQIGIPAGRTARLNITTGSGQVTSELPIDAVSTTKAAPITIRVRTGSGDIRLLRAGQAPVADAQVGS